MQKEVGPSRVTPGDGFCESCKAKVLSMTAKLCDICKLRERFAECYACEACALREGKCALCQKKNLKPENLLKPEKTLKPE